MLSGLSETLVAHHRGVRASGMQWLWTLQPSLVLRAPAEVLVREHHCPLLVELGQANRERGA